MFTKQLYRREQTLFLKAVPTLCRSRNCHYSCSIFFALQRGKNWRASPQLEPTTFSLVRDGNWPPLSSTSTLPAPCSRAMVISTLFRLSEVICANKREACSGDSFGSVSMDKLCRALSCVSLTSSVNASEFNKKGKI